MSHQHNHKLEWYKSDECSKCGNSLKFYEFEYGVRYLAWYPSKICNDCVGNLPIKSECKRCGEEFESRNELFIHLRIYGHFI